MFHAIFFLQLTIYYFSKYLYYVHIQSTLTYVRLIFPKENAFRNNTFPHSVCE